MRIVHESTTMRTPNPLVSIIIPAYNEEAHLAECLRSLQTQTYPALEIIVVDDGSRDGTASVAKASGVKVLQQNHNGKARAIATGAGAADEELFCFLGGDVVFSAD